MHPKHPDYLNGFARVHLQAGLDVIALIRERRLQLRDKAILDAVCYSIDRTTGKTALHADAIAALVGVDPATCRASLSRLKKHFLLALWKDKDSGHTFYVVNPWFYSVGGARRRGYLKKCFEEAING